MVTVEEARNYLRIDNEDDDDLIEFTFDGNNEALLTAK